MDAVLPNGGHEQACKAADPAFEGIAAGQCGRDDDAKYGEPEKFIGAEFERNVPQQGREQG